MNEANDYDGVADLYDAYVRADFDLRFFRDLARECDGPVLELMAGTGRVTRTLYAERSDLTCVDISLDMLRVLRNKAADLTPAPSVICADLRALPLRAEHFGLAVIPFNSFAELTRPEDQRAALFAIARALRPGGTFVCTLHNPEVRARTLDGQERRHGPFELEGGRRLEMAVRGRVEATGLAASDQTYRTFDSTGALVDERRQTVRFALLTRTGFTERVEAAGLEVVRLAGDYDGAPFSDDSPYMIWWLEKRGRAALAFDRPRRLG